MAILFALRHHYHGAALFAKSSVALCVMAYLALTAPISNHHYGWLRPPLLLLTDLTSFALLNYYWFSVHGRSVCNALHGILKIVALTWLLCLLILFLGFGGNHFLHDINHFIGFVVLSAIVLDSIRGYEDDLNESRRLLRRIMIGAISAYMLLLTLLELTDSQLRDNPLFSISNALLALTLISILSWRLLQKLIPENQPVQTSSDTENKSGVINDPESDKQFSANSQTLKEVMQSGFYTQHDISVGKLASELGMPAHQLRVLINQELGFDNFSQFINSYRIPAVCEKLKDPKRNKDPILTIALETGYNSIASFNRTFKQQTGMTPSEFRAQF